LKYSNLALVASDETTGALSVRADSYLPRFPATKPISPIHRKFDPRRVIAARRTIRCHSKIDFVFSIDQEISEFDLSRDGKRLVMRRGAVKQDVMLIRDLR